MTTRAEPTEIGILVYPGAQLAAVHGLTDLLGIASGFAAGDAGAGSPALSVTHWQPSPSGIACTYRSLPGVEPQPGFVILPPTLADLPDAETSETISRWLIAAHGRGAGLVSICSGIFLVAPTGLLDGRRVSTHWSCARNLTASFPAVSADAEERLIEYPGILTAGGFMAWLDVGLMLVERLLGPAVRMETARFTLTGHSPGEAPAMAKAGFMPRHDHGDAAVRRAQDFIHVRDGLGVPLAALAAAAGLERRTFMRRFVAATGRTPIDYCRAVRIARAGELLEAGDMPLKQIAEQLGYADVSSFARAFRRANGIPPAAYRERQGGARVGRA